jgi:voltage-gated sodium channel
MSTQRDGVRRQARALVEHPRFQSLIIGVIVMNAITLGLEVNLHRVESAMAVLHVLDRIAIAVFVVEIVIRLVAYGWSFFRSAWSIFDLLIVIISLIPAAGALSVLRALRILRVTRLFSTVASMRTIINALVGAIPAMGSIMLVMVLLLYIGAVLAAGLFGSSFERQFGSLEYSMLTLFQLMTLDGWSAEIVGPIMDVYPWAWVFFIPYIIITSFAVLNLFIGVLMSNIEADKQERDASHAARLEQRLDTLSQQVVELQRLIERQSRDS